MQRSYEKKYRNCEENVIHSDKINGGDIKNVPYNKTRSMK